VNRLSVERDIYEDSFEGARVSDRNAIKLHICGTEEDFRVYLLCGLWFGASRVAAERTIYKDSFVGIRV
jgi:hypothetical protein